MKNARTSRFGRGRWWPALFLAAGVLLPAADLFAVVGRPLTPVSYAGVARRTTRRSVYAGAAVGAGVAVGATAVAAASIATLPPGCGRMTLTGATYYNCGGTYYRPQYDGPNVVYVVAQPPPQ
jgi:hypothetical protein